MKIFRKRCQSKFLASTSLTETTQGTKNNFGTIEEKQGKHVNLWFEEVFNVHDIVFNFWEKNIMFKYTKSFTTVNRFIISVFSCFLFQFRHHVVYMPKWSPFGWHMNDKLYIDNLIFRYLWYVKMLKSLMFWCIFYLVMYVQYLVTYVQYLVKNMQYLVMYAYYLVM